MGQNNADRLPPRGAETSAVLLVLAIALGLRVWGIAAEPYWTDEVFSDRFSRIDIPTMLTATGRDDHPPLYYFGLHFWRQVVGNSRAWLRGYSVAWSLLGLLALFLLARDVGGRRAALFALILAAVNAQDIYFAQEARMYIQGAALCTISSWCLWRWLNTTADKIGWRYLMSWPLAYTVSAAAALYSHYMCVVVLVAQGLFALGWFAMRRAWVHFVVYLGASVVVAGAFLPWMVFVIGLRKTLLNPALTWIGVPRPTDYFSFLGREFVWGHVGQLHNRYWALTMIPIVALAVFCFWRCRSPRGERPGSETGRGCAGIIYLGWLLAGTMLLVALVVNFYHPVYHRPRFSVFLLAPFLVLAALGCDGLSRRWAAWGACGTIAFLMLGGTLLQQFTYQKVPLNRIADLVKSHKPAHVVFFPERLAASVRLLTKTEVRSLRRSDLEGTPTRITGELVWLFSVVGHNFDARDNELKDYLWWRSQSAVRSVAISEGLRMEIVTVGAFAMPTGQGEMVSELFQPVDVPESIEGFCDVSRFHMLETDGATDAPYRWSAPKAWLRLGQSDRVSTIVVRLELPPRIPQSYMPDLRIYARRGEDSGRLFESTPRARLKEYKSGTFQIAFPVPDGSEPLWIGWTVNSVNLAREAVSSDTRDLGIKIIWIAVINKP